MKYKLFCTVTMQTYYIDGKSEYDAKNLLARQLNVPLSTIDVYMK